MSPNSNEKIIEKELKFRQKCGTLQIHLTSKPNKTITLTTKIKIKKNPRFFH